MEGQHRFHVHAHRLLGGVTHSVWICFLFGQPLLNRPADRQVAVHRVMCTGLVGHAVRAHPAPDQFRQDVGGIAEQCDGFCLASLRVLRDARECVIKVGGLLIDIARLQAEIDAGLAAFDVEAAHARQRCGEWLRATHATQACGEQPLAPQRTAVVLATHFDERFIGALHDALAADVDPAAGGHLPVHHQTLLIEFVEVFPCRPMRHQVGIGDQYARRVGMAGKYANRLAGLHQQGFIVVEVFQRFDDRVIAIPITRGTADAAVDDELRRVLGDFGVKIILQHPERCFGQP
jgi:hypothetical protein